MSDPNPPRQGISFHALREAFAQVLRGRKKTAPPEEEQPATPPPEPVEEKPPEDEIALPVEVEERPEGEPLEDDDASCPVSPQSILEAMLFVGSSLGEPLPAAKVAELMRGVEVGDVPDLVDGLNHRYQAGGCPYQILSVGAGYRLSLRPEFNTVRERFYGRIREARLSPAAIDVLAIVAYRQPLSADDVTRLRGFPSAHLLAQMVRRRLLRIERPEEKGKLPVYHTTDRFLELFGMTSLEDLPQAEDV